MKLSTARGLVLLSGCLLAAAPAPRATAQSASNRVPPSRSFQPGQFRPGSTPSPTLSGQKVFPTLFPGKGGLPSFSDVGPTASVTLLTTTVGSALHLEVPGLAGSVAPHLQTHTWDFGDKGGSYNALGGFNAAHVYASAGVYTVRRDGQQIAQVVVRRAADAVPVETSAELRAVLGAGGSAQLPPGTLLLEDSIDVAPGARLVGSPGGSSQLYWTGSASGAMLYAYRGGLTVSDVTFASRFYQTTDGNAPDAIRLGGSANTILGCRFVDVRTAVNGNGRPDGTLVQDCVVSGVTDLRGYLVWAEGRRWTLLGNRVPNSTRETPVRISAIGGTANCQMVLIWGNALANIERQAVDPQDTVKSALRVEAADFVWVEHNEFGGMAEAGPLGEGDGLASAYQRASYVVWRNNVHRGPVRLKHGLQHVLVEDSRIDYLGGSVGGWVTAVTVEGVDPRYGRFCTDVTIRRNLITTPRHGERQIWVQGVVAGGLAFSNNTLVQGRSLAAPVNRASIAYEGGWQPGYVSQSNLFPAGGDHGWPNPLAVVQAGGQNDVASYLTAPQWLTLDGVSGDVFADLPMP